MLRTLLWMVCSIPIADSCLQCERIIRVTHEDFILSAPTLKDQLDLKDIFDHAYETYKETSTERKGIIDPTTLYRARTQYQAEFDRFLKTERTGSLGFETIQIVEKGRQILEKHLDTFIRDGLCPNKCGLLRRRVMDCLTCNYKTHTCISPTGKNECGEKPLQADEGGQAVLDCYLPWHYLILERPEYNYSFAAGVPNTKPLRDSDFRALVVTRDAFVVLNQLHVGEQGTYRCTLRDEKQMVIYRITFLLRVTSSPFQTSRPVVTPLSLPPADASPLQSAENVLVPIIAIIITLSVTAIIGLTVALGCMIKQISSRRGQRAKQKYEE